MPPVFCSAPGKVMVAGEYAVLSGARALVLAVDARATARLSTDVRDGSQARSNDSPARGALPWTFREASMAPSLDEA